MKVSELIASLQTLPDLDAEILLQDISEPVLGFEWIGFETKTTWTGSFERGELTPIPDTVTVTILKVKT